MYTYIVQQLIYMHHTREVNMCIDFVQEFIPTASEDWRRTKFHSSILDTVVSNIHSVTQTRILAVPFTLPYFIPYFIKY